MKLVSVEIHNFKSIKEEIIDIKADQLCFVGKNESGKSSVILAISYLNILDTEFDRKLLNKNAETYPNGFPVVIGTFELSSEDYAKTYEIISGLFEPEEYDSLPTTSDKVALQLKRWGNGFNNISLVFTDKENFDFSPKITTFYDKFFAEIYPEIQYFENEELLLEPSSIDELLGRSKKFETFRKLLKIGGCENFNDLKNPDINFVVTFLSSIETKFNLVFSNHYKQDQSINIKVVTAPNNKLTLIISDSSNQSFSIDERSPGFQYYFAFLINKLYTTEINKSKNSIILLDEPGKGLHPQGAKDLLKSFDEIANNSQILYTTHDPFLVIRNDIDSLFFVEKKANKGTKVTKKPYLNKYQVFRKELGILLNDSFLVGDMNLVVEGITEKFAFHKLFQIEKYRELEWLNIYNADGVPNVPQAINYLGKNNLKLSGIVILDSDKEARNIKKNKFYKKNIGENNWTEIEINSVFNDNQDRTFEDLFPQKNYIDAFNQYCNALKSADVFGKDYENLEYIEELATPIYNTLAEHFKSFLPEGSKSSIVKQDIIRELFNIVEKKTEEEQNLILEKAFKLIDKIKDAFNQI